VQPAPPLIPGRGFVQIYIESMFADDALLSSRRTVRPGQLLEVRERVQPAPPQVRGSREASIPPMEVVFEDDHIACIVKPQGIATQVGS